MVTSTSRKTFRATVITAEALARVPVLSISTTFAARMSSCSRAATSDAARVRSVRSRSARSGRYVTMLTVNVAGVTSGNRVAGVG